MSFVYFILFFLCLLFFFFFLDSIMPRAHTCFSKLDLPIYSSKNEMQIYLSLVINLEISGGFSLE